MPFLQTCSVTSVPSRGLPPPPSSSSPSSAATPTVPLLLFATIALPGIRGNNVNLTWDPQLGGPATYANASWAEPLCGDGATSIGTPSGSLTGGASSDGTGSTRYWVAWRVAVLATCGSLLVVAGAVGAVLVIRRKRHDADDGSSSGKACERARKGSRDADVEQGGVGRIARMSGVLGAGASNSPGGRVTAGATASNGGGGGGGGNPRAVRVPLADQFDDSFDLPGFELHMFANGTGCHAGHDA